MRVPAGYVRTHTHAIHLTQPMDGWIHGWMDGYMDGWMDGGRAGIKPGEEARPHVERPSTHTPHACTRPAPPT
jgi:hypothetical protein